MPSRWGDEREKGARRFGRLPLSCHLNRDFPSMVTLIQLRRTTLNIPPWCPPRLASRLISVSRPIWEMPGPFHSVIHASEPGGYRLLCTRDTHSLRQAQPQPSRRLRWWIALAVEVTVGSSKLRLAESVSLSSANSHPYVRLDARQQSFGAAASTRNLGEST